MTLINTTIERIHDGLGPTSVLIGEGVRSRPGSGRDPVGCAAAALVLPRSTVEVAAALRICHQAGVPVVPRAGMTGLVGGTVAGPHEMALSRSAEERRAMALLKRALDPTNILNPGTILDPLS